MTDNITKHVKTIARVERLRNTHFGNPVYTIFFTDGSKTDTMPDSGWAYEAANADNHGVPMMFEYLRGKVRWAHRIDE